MVRRYYDLPSLTALAAFEACARHMSLKRAAAELNVTPGALSRQIKVLEDELGVPVFERLGSGVELTNAGSELYAVLSQSFSRASGAVKSIKNGDRSMNVIIACTDAFASMWLVPRMTSFWEKYPEISVDFLVTDDARDFRRAEVDLRVRYGHGSWPDEYAEFLLDDRIYPVCGPAFALENSDVTAQSLPDLPLLHVDWIAEIWGTWDDVLRRAGIPHGPIRGRRFGKLFVTLQAAQANQGVAVGWHRMVGPLIAEGKLVKFTDLELRAHGGYYLTWNENRQISPSADLFHVWLRDIAAKEMGKI